MTINLSAIKFTVETAQLKEAIGLLGDLKKASNAVSETAKARKESIQVQREELKLQQEAEKTAQKKIKTESDQAKLAREKTKGLQSAADAEQDLTEKIKGSQKMLEKQSLSMKILRGETWDLAGASINLGEGFTKSQSSQLALMKLIGGTSEEMKGLATEFKNYNAITGLNTFDKSASGVSKLKKELEELNQVEQLTKEGMSLTRDEVVNLSRDLTRLKQQYLSEGKSIEDIVSAQSLLRKQYIETTSALNQKREAAKEMEIASKAQARAEIQAASDLAKANSYVDRELEKVRFALDETNEAYGRGATNSILRFEKALASSGKSIQEQTSLLNEYRIAQMQLQKAGQNRAVDTISRAIGPQITDVVVGLTTGQSPLMVLLQQGGQLRDQFALAGVEAKDFGITLRKSFADMIPTIIATGKGIGSFITGGLYDAGKAMTVGFNKAVLESALGIKVFANGVTSAKSDLDDFLATGQGAGKAISALLRIGAVGAMATTMAVALAGTVVVLGLFLYKIWDVVKAESALSVAMNTQAAAMGLNTDAALHLTKTVSDLGVSQEKGIEVLNAMAKTGYKSADSFREIADAAHWLEKVGASSVEEFVKKAADIGKDPVAALLKFQIETGKVNEAIITQVRELKAKGDTQAAVSMAEKEAARASKEAAQQTYEEFGKLKQLTVDVGESFENMWSKIWNMGARKTPGDELKQMQEDLKRTESDEGPESGRVKQLKWLIAAKKEEIQISAASKQNEQGRSLAAEAQLAVDAKTLSLVREMNAERAKGKSLGAYTDARFRQEFDDSQMMVMTLQQETAWRAKFRKEWEDGNKPKSGPKDNTFQTQAQAFKDSLSTMKELLADRLAMLKSSRDAEMLTEEQYRTRNLAEYSKSATEQLDLITSYESQQRKVLEGKLKGTTSGTVEYENLRNQLDVLTQTAKNAKKEVNSELFKQYSLGITEAAKGLFEYNKALKKTIEDEATLRSDRESALSLAFKTIGMTSDEASALQAEADERKRISKLIEDEKKKREDLARAVSTGESEVASAALDPSIGVKEYIELTDKNKVAVDRLTESQRALLRLQNDLANNPATVKATQELTQAVSNVKSKIDIVNQLDLGTSIASGFDAGSTAIGGMVGALNQLIKAQEDYNKLKDSNKLEKGDEEKLQRANISYYAKLSGETKKYFKQHTAGYKILETTEKAFRAMELVETLKVFATKIGLLEKLNLTTIMGYADQAGAAIISAGTQIGALFGLGQAMATNAVLAQGAGEPYSAPVRMAAMAATVAALGFAVGGSFGGSNKAPTYNTGAGTVLGDSKAQSSSLGGSLERLKDINDLTLQTSQSMLKSLEAIEINTQGLTSLIARSMNLQTQEASVPVGWKGNETLGGVFSGLDSILGIGNFFGNIGNKLFGTSTKIKGSGFTGGPQELGDIMSGGFQGQYFTDIQTKKKVVGITRKTTNKTIYSEADADVEDQITKIFSGIYDTILTSSSMLGLAFNDVDENLKNFVVDIGRVNTYGKTGEEIQKELSAVFSAAGDKIAEAAIPGLKEFQKVGEGYLETTIRVASGIEEARNITDRLNLTLVDYQKLQEKQVDVGSELVRQSILAKEGTSGIAELIELISGSASEISEAYVAFDEVRTVLGTLGFASNAMSLSLIKGSGSVDALKNSLSSFQENYLSDTERLAIQTALMQKEFAKLGMTLPANAEEFKNLVLGVDASSASGTELLGRLLALSEGFSSIADSAKAVQEERLGLESQLLELQGNTAELRRRELETLDPSNRALQEQIWLLESQKTATEEAAKAQEQLVEAFKTAGKAIAEEINRLLGISSKNDSTTLQSTFAIKTAAARSGDVEALKALPELSKSIESAILSTATTELEVARMRAYLANSLTGTMQTLGISQDSSGNVQVGTSLTGSTSSGATGAIIVDNTNKELLAELKTLNAKVADMEAAAVSTALSNSKMQRLLDRLSPDGESLTVVVNTDAGPVSVDQV